MDESLYDQHQRAIRGEVRIGDWVRDADLPFVSGQVTGEGSITRYGWPVWIIRRRGGEEDFIIKGNAQILGFGNDVGRG